MSLEIVVGPMFSGKSTYALSYIRRQRAIDKRVVVIKPNIDNRYSEEQVLVTHNNEKTPCILWDTDQNLSLINEMIVSDCIVFEEAQFFTGLTNIVMYVLRTYEKDILIVGLDGDAHQKPFGDILNCIPWANKVTKLCALCKKCNDGTEAPFTKKLKNDNQLVDVGGSDKYESVCLKHL
jgi:thymidine kinase